MSNTNTTELWVYKARVTLPTGDRIEVIVAGKHLDYQETGIGIKTHIREVLRRDYKATYVRVGQRVGITTTAIARRNGWTIVSTSKASLARSIKSHGERIQKAVERKDERAKYASLSKKELVALLTNA